MALQSEIGVTRSALGPSIALHAEQQLHAHLCSEKRRLHASLCIPKRACAPKPASQTGAPAAPRAHLHLPVRSPPQADGDAVHRDQQLPHEGLCSSHLLLHPHQERLQLPLFLPLFSRSQRVSARPGKMQQHSIERPERCSSQLLAAPAAIGVASPHPVLHHARFVCAAARWLALHLAVPFANAALAATLAGVELLTPLQIAAVVQAAALRRRDAAVAALQVAGVAKTAFGARGGRVAAVIFLLVGAAGGAGEAAELVVLIRGAHGACKRRGVGVERVAKVVL